MPTYSSRRRLPIRPATRPVPGAIASRTPLSPISQQAIANVGARRNPNQPVGPQQPYDHYGQFQQQAYAGSLASQLGQNGANAMQDRIGRAQGVLNTPYRRPQTLDSVAALQGRRTATGAQYPTDIDQGPEQRAFQPNAGNYGLSSVSVSPSGRATMVGGYDEIRPGSRLAQLGVNSQMSRPYDDGSPGGVDMTDRSEMYARQGANRQRMENILASRRTGIPITPGDPAQPGMGADYTAALRAQGNDRNRLSQMLAQRRQGRTQPQQTQGGNTPPNAEQMARDQRRELVGTFAEQLAGGTMPLDRLNELSGYIQNGPQQTPAGGNNAGNITVARAAIQGITDPAAAVAKLVEQRFDQAVIDQVEQELTRNLPPAEQQAIRDRIRNQAARRTYTTTRPQLGATSSNRQEQNRNTLNDMQVVY